MITTDEIEVEKEYLKNVCRILAEEIENYDQKVKALSTNIQEQMTYAWDKTNRLSDTEFVYALANIQKRSVYAENANRKVTSYKKMLNNAYFARIDFDDGEEVLPIYIGIASLQQGDDFMCMTGVHQFQVCSITAKLASQVTLFLLVKKLLETSH